jgi:hypothetical protein
MAIPQQFVIRFQDTSLAEANVLAESLRDAILDSHPDVSVKTQRDDPSLQDFGATLVLLLGAPAVVVVAKGIEQWLKRHQSASVRIEGPDGIIVAENVTGNQAVELAKLLHKRYVPSETTQT